MSVFKLSLGTGFFNDQAVNRLRENQLVSIHPDTPSKGQSGTTQAEYFLNANVGDIIYVCRSNESVEYIGMFADKRPLQSIVNGHSDWVDRSIEILYDAGNPRAYDRVLDRWWTPKNFSTFVEIPDADITEFEAAILQPVFGVSHGQLIAERDRRMQLNAKTIQDYAGLQQEFDKYQDHPDTIIEKVNSLSRIELGKLHYAYEQRGDISHQPVVRLRKRLLEELLAGNPLTHERINEVKREIDLDFDKNVFLVWKSAHRILYTFLFEQHKKNLEDYFNEMIRKIQNELNIADQTKIKLVDLDGPQNQGFDRIWFAIYNNTFKSQKLAKQLFLEIHNGFRYGLLDHFNNDLSKLELAEQFNYQDVVNTFSKYVKTILSDNSMEKAKIGEYIDILEYKKQIVLQGPPGTGKTHNAKKIAKQLAGGLDSERVKIVQFHPSYSYEDFVRGISAKSVDERVTYETENKVLASFAEKASGSEEPFVLIIDEINRANLPVVLGELIYALEYRGDSVETVYAIRDSNKISIPENLYIIGTMNTADRSVGHIDYAIKRRFAFVDVLPDDGPINHDKAKELFALVSSLFVTEKDGKKINSPFLAADFDFKDVQLGHSYFILKEGTEEEQKEELRLRLKYEVLPILREYVKDGLLIENNQLTQKIESITNFEI